MKRILLTLFFASIIIIHTNAENHDRENIRKRSTRIEYVGDVNLVSAGLLYNVVEPCFVLSTTTTHGIKIGRNFYTGLGVGIYVPFGVHQPRIPLYMNFKGIFDLNHSIEYFVSLDMGADLLIEATFISKDKYANYLMQPGIGLIFSSAFYIELFHRSSMNFRHNDNNTHNMGLKFAFLF